MKRITILAVLALALCAAPAFAQIKKHAKQDKPAAAAAAAPPAAAAPAPATPETPKGDSKDVAPLDPNTPLAKVGDSVITADDFGRFARFRLRRASAEAGKKIEADAKFRMQAMSELVASRLLEALAKEAKVEASEEDVEKDFTASKKAFKSDDEYKEYLKTQGLTEAQLRDEVRRKLLIDRFVASKTKDITVTPEEVQKQYDEFKAKGSMNRDEKTVDLAQIVALFTPGDAESEKAAKAKIDAVRERVLKGEKFEDVGTQVSKDPEAGMQMGMIDEAKPTSLYPDIAKAVENLKAGEVSETMRTPRGYGLVMVKGWYEPGVVPFEKVKTKIEEQLKSAKNRDTLAALLKDAKGRIPVEMYKTQAGEAGAPAEATPRTVTPAPPATDDAPKPGGLLSPDDLQKVQ